jgi:hypothetical protein
MRSKAFIAIVSVLAALAAASFPAQSQTRNDSPSLYGRGGVEHDDPTIEVIEGEGVDRSDKFSFIRIRYGRPTQPGDVIGDPPSLSWSHDYPDGGIHFSKIMSEVSKIRITLDTPEYIFRLDDPNIFKYPFAYLCEVGYMTLSDSEIAGMREYCLRGGFIIVDDFRRPYQMENFLYYIKRAFPEFEMKELDVTNPIFNCFFSMKTLDVKQPYDRGKPYFYGISDKHGRIMMVINYNNDISDFWQWANDNSMYPIEDTNEGFKFGVDYAIYALTH